MAYFLGTDRRLEVLSIIKRRGVARAAGARRTSRSGSRGRGREIEAAVAIALGGMVAEELFLGESGTGPGADLATATQVGRARWSGALGMGGSLISYEAVSEGADRRGRTWWARCSATAEGKARVEDILDAQKEKVAALLEENRDVVDGAPRRADRARRAGRRGDPRGPRGASRPANRAASRASTGRPR